MLVLGRQCSTCNNCVGVSMSRTPNAPWSGLSEVTNNQNTVSQAPLSAGECELAEGPDWGTYGTRAWI